MARFMVGVVAMGWGDGMVGMGVKIMGLVLEIRGGVWAGHVKL